MLEVAFHHIIRTVMCEEISVKVQPQLFLVSPSQKERKGAEIHLVTTENCYLFVTRWKNSKLFDFGSLYQEEGTTHLYSATCIIAIRTAKTK